MRLKLISIITAFLLLDTQLDGWYVAKKNKNATFEEHELSVVIKESCFPFF